MGIAHIVQILSKGGPAESVGREEPWKSMTSRVSQGDPRIMDRPFAGRGVDGRDKPAMTISGSPRRPKRSNTPSRQLGELPLNSLLRKAKFAVVPVLVVRPQDAIGEMAPVRRIRESLRLEGQARMRAVMLAVQSGRRTVEGR
jgi:hypothetical protein